jgi:hypothetical protein
MRGRGLPQGKALTLKALLQRRELLLVKAGVGKVWGRPREEGEGEGNAPVSQAGSPAVRPWAESAAAVAYPQTGRGRPPPLRPPAVRTRALQHLQPAAAQLHREIDIVAVAAAARRPPRLGVACGARAHVCE